MMRIAILLFAASCAGESVGMPPGPPVNWEAFKPPPPKPPDAGPLSATEQERRTAAVYHKALSSPGFAELKAALDEEAHFAFAGMKDAYGRDAVVKAHDTLFGAYERRSFVTTRLWLTDSAQALEWAMTGTHAPSGKSVVIRGVTLLWTKDDGSINDVHLYFDEAAVKAQLGAGPKELVALPKPTMPQATLQEFEQTRNAVESANVAQVRAAIDALEKSSDGEYLATMSDDVEVFSQERAQPARGKAEAHSYFQGLHRSIAYVDSSIMNLWGVRDFVVAEYSIVGEQRGALGWIPARPNTVVKIYMVDVVELRDGKIARVWRYDNPSQILAAP